MYYFFVLDMDMSDRISTLCDLLPSYRDLEDQGLTAIKESLSHLKPEEFGTICFKTLRTKSVSIQCVKKIYYMTFLNVFRQASLHSWQ